MATPVQTQQSIDGQIAHLERELLELKRQRNKLSPVSTIPPEVLCHILLLATSYPRNIDHYDIPERLRVERCNEILLHVSHSWRSTALGCPQLWAEIDVGIKTDSRQIEFMVKQAHPYPASLHIQAVTAVPPARQNAQLKALSTVIRILSGNGGLNGLIFMGGIDLLLVLLPVVQSETLRTLQVAVADGGSVRGLTQEGAMIARCPLFDRGMPGLRALSLEGCVTPLTLPILIRSPQLTSLSLHVQEDSKATHLLDLLRNTPLLQNFDFDFRGLLAPSQAILEPVHLRCLRKITLRGCSNAVITTVSHLRLSAMDVTLHLHILLQLHSNMPELGANLIGALAQARSAPETVPVRTVSEQPFLPCLLVFGRSPWVMGVEGMDSLRIGKWTTPGDAPLDDVCYIAGFFPTTGVSVSFFEAGTWSLIDGAKWHPLLLANHPRDLQPTGWSMDALRTVSVRSDWGYCPDSFWPLLSECPKIVELFIAASHLPKFCPTLYLDHGRFPFPSLRTIEVRMPTFATLAEPSTRRQECESLLGTLFQALRKRQTLSNKYGVSREWVLDKLSLACCTSIQQLATAHTQGLVKLIRCGALAD